jgi:hypothetical protein
LPIAVAAAIREDAVVEDEADSGGDDADQVKPGTAPDPPPGLVAASGAKDPSFGDGRVPTEMNWGIQDLPERVQENALAFVVRQGPLTNLQQPRFDLSLMTKLGWIAGIRRAVLTKHN